VYALSQQRMNDMPEDFFCPRRLECENDDIHAKLFSNQLLQGIVLLAPQHILSMDPDWYSNFHNDNFPNAYIPSLKVSIDSIITNSEFSSLPFDYKITISRDPPRRSGTSGESQWFTLHQFRTSMDAILDETAVVRGIDSLVPVAAEEIAKKLEDMLAKSVGGQVIENAITGGEEIVKRVKLLIESVTFIEDISKALENEQKGKETAERTREAIIEGNLSDALAFGTTLIVTSDGRYVVCTLYFDVRELEFRLDVFNNETGRNLDVNDVMEKVRNGEIDQDIIDFAAWYNHNGERKINNPQRPWLKE